MPKDKEKALNPAAAQRKADKQKALKKGKAAVTAQRTERLAKQNPHRIQRQIDDLKAVEAGSGALNQRYQRTLEELERDLVRVKKAKESVGDKYIDQRRPAGAREASGARHGDREGTARHDGVLGKRSRGGGRDRRRANGDESSDTDEDVKNIPMPRDTPPPLPRPRQWRDHGSQATNANATPLGEGRERIPHVPHALPPKPEVPIVRTVYESKPIIRDLRKEALKFAPAAVRRKIDATKGAGGKLLEEEELAELEKEGYGGTKQEDTQQADAGTAAINFESVERGDAQEESRNLAEEEERWRREMYQVQVEEVVDEELG